MPLNRYLHNYFTGHKHVLPTTLKYYLLLVSKNRKLTFCGCENFFPR